jgi:hypothetical protein
MPVEGTAQPAHDRAEEHVVQLRIALMTALGVIAAAAVLGASSLALTRIVREPPADDVRGGR